MFYSKIGDYVLLCNGKVAREVLPDLRPAICSKEFTVKILPPVDLDSLRLGDKIRLASGKIETVKEIMPSGKLVLVFTDRFCVAYEQTGSTVCSDQSFNIVEIIPQVDLHTLKAGDTVELASGETKKVTSAEYSPSEAWRGVKVVFNADKAYFVTDFLYNRNGTLPYFPMDSIVKIIPKPKLDFSMNAVDLTTLKEGDTVHLSDRSTAEVVSVTSKMLGTIYLIRLRRLGFNLYYVDGCSLGKDKPSIVRIVDTSTAKERVVPKPKLNLYTLEPGAVVTLANGNTKEVLKVDFQSRAHTSHVCITFADGAWIYNSDGTRPPGRDSACNIIGVVKNIDVSTIKPGDVLTLASGMKIAVADIVELRDSPSRFTISYANPFPTSFTVDIKGFCKIHPYSIVKITPKPKPTPLTINSHVVKPGDTVKLANGNTKTVLEVDRKSRAHTNHICIKFADGTWIYNPDGTRPPGRDSAYNVVGVTTAAILAGIKADKKFFESIDVSAIKRGDRLTHANGKEVIAGGVTARLAAGETYTVWHENGLPIVDVHANGIALRTESHAWSIVKITPKPKPTPLTINGHIVKPGDVLTRAIGDRIVVDKITPEPCGNWKVWHSAHGGCFFEADSSGHSSALPELSITAVIPNQTVTQGQPGTRMTLERLTQLVEQRPSAFTEIAQLTGRSVTDLLSDLEKGLSVPWPKPITTPPTKKDADPIGQVAVLDKDGDWMQEEWWAARDMLTEGKITGWAHTQVWHDAKNKLSDPWN